MAHAKMKSASSRAITRSSAVETGPNVSEAQTASASSTTNSRPIPGPKLCIPAGKPSHSTTPTTATPTTTRASSPTRSNRSSDQSSSPKITPPPETEFSKVQVHEALKFLRCQGSNAQSTTVPGGDITDSEELDSEVELLDDAEVDRPWSPLLQPESPPRHKVKRKRGVSDVSRDQVSTEESPNPTAIDEEEGDEEEDEEELELEGTSMHL